MSSPLEIMIERRAAKKQELDELLALPTAEKRDLTTDEDEKFTTLVPEIRAQDERIKELTDQADREAAAAETRRMTQSTTATSTQVREPDIYVKDGPVSYFRDMFTTHKGQDSAASERLHRNAIHMLETRALGNTGAVGGSGGEFAPPAWMVDEWVHLIRPGRVTANLFTHEDVPVGISSLNYPKLATGTTVAPQTTQNSALSSTDPTTTFIQTGFATLGGKNVASQQILDQARNFDRVILSDLAAAYAQGVGTQIYLGTGTGTGTGAVINGLGAATIGSTQTWNQGAPTAGGFYGQTAALLSKFLTARLLPPNCWVMHPRRWYWLESQLDTTNRPLVALNSAAFNPIATENLLTPAGPVGTMHGLPVILDPLVPINLGGGTNQDNVYLLKTDDLVLLESPPQVEVFREPYADSLGVLFRLYAYVATILNRHPESLGVLTGTGLVTPVFGS